VVELCDEISIAPQAVLSPWRATARPSIWQVSSPVTMTVVTFWTRYPITYAGDAFAVNVTAGGAFNDGAAVVCLVSN
jgi:hypothetical protein